MSNLFEKEIIRERMQSYPEEEQTNCPRCNSSNTKFCYYNNYNLCQPRHVCKACKRYWTKGGSLRNIPVGGVARKNKRSSNPKRSSASISSSASPPAKQIVDLNEDFSETKLHTEPISSSESNAIAAERVSVEDSSSCEDGNRWLDLSFSSPGSVKKLVNYL